MSKQSDKEMAEYLPTLKKMDKRTLFHQFFRKQGPISRYHVMLEIEEQALAEELDPYDYMFPEKENKEIVKIKRTLHNVNQESMYDPLAKDILKK